MKSLARTCFAAKDNLNFNKIDAESVYEHQDIHIGGSEGLC